MFLSAKNKTPISMFDCILHCGNNNNNNNNINMYAVVVAVSIPMDGLLNTNTWTKSSNENDFLRIELRVFAGFQW